MQGGTDCDRLVRVVRTRSRVRNELGVEDRNKGHEQAANQRTCQEMGRLLMFRPLWWQENPEREERGEGWLQQESKLTLWPVSSLVTKRRLLQAALVRR